MKSSIINQIKIKDLKILQTPWVYKEIENDILSAERKGICIWELPVNPYIYETRSMNIEFLCKYIKTLDGLAGVFRELYDNLVYKLRLEKLIDFDMDDSSFQFIFNAVINAFNRYIDDRYLFDDFCIYMSDVSLQTGIILYDVFNSVFIALFGNMIDSNKLRYQCIYKNMINPSIIYTNIYKQFEPIMSDFIVY